MNALVCRGVSKVYGKDAVVKSVDLVIEPNKIYGLIGKNGAGKTTLLSMLSAQNPLSAGTITMGDADVWENQTALDQICFSREIATTTLFGRDGTKVKGMLKTAAILFPLWDTHYAAELIERFKIDVNKRLSALSKGMLSAVTIVIAMASKAPYTFLDEPVSGLDVFMRDQFYKLLLEEFSASERTFVVSSHIIDEAAGVLEEVIIIDEGEIVTKQNTDMMLSRHRMIHGKREDVEAVTQGVKVIDSETHGRRVTLYVEVDDVAAFEARVNAVDVDVNKPTLQQLLLKLLN